MSNKNIKKAEPKNRLSYYERQIIEIPAINKLNDNEKFWRIK